MANGQLAEALAKGNPLVTMGLEVGDALAQLRPARGETVNLDLRLPGQEGQLLRHG
ncbi:hypothetical protein P7F60_28870 [Rhizobium sp. YJ-22]|uniref:hypothetical protein n=1 Tax=Rhizobium sp. YJ-22 TaxID=3037556 RepID=UPI0024127492|nr:hypothetical protein [Rhizobium sp. YJ-22]MDG3580396.1 hypothetical protein [Rhizobium sp. YJ-22]